MNIIKCIQNKTDVVKYVEDIVVNLKKYYLLTTIIKLVKFVVYYVVFVIGDWENLVIMLNY